MSALRPCPTLKIDSFFLAGPGNRGGLSPVFRPRLRPAEKTGTVTVYSSPGARIPRVPPRPIQRTGPSHGIPATENPSEEFRALSLPPSLGNAFSSPFSVWGSHMRGYSENESRTEVALTPGRPRSVCEVRLRGLPGSASFMRLRNRSARLQPPRQPAR